MTLQKLISHPRFKPGCKYVFAWLLWLAATWLVADHILATRVTALIQEKIRANDQQSVNIANGIDITLASLHGTPAMVARDGNIMNALSRFGPNTRPATLPIEQRKKHWSDDPRLRSVDGFLKLVDTTMGTNTVFLMNAGGDCVASSNADAANSLVGSNFAHRKYFQEAMAGKPGFQYALGKTTNIPGLFFSAPVFSDARVVGVVAEKINLPALLHLVDQADAFITDEYGVIILAQNPQLEMRSLPGAAISGLSSEARMALYKREDLPVLTIKPWSNHWGAKLYRIDEESLPVVLAERSLQESEIKVHVYMRLPEIIEMTQDRLIQFAVFGICGAFVLLLIRGNIAYKRNQKQNELLLLSILNASPIAVRISANKGRKVVFYNPSYAQLIKNPDAMGDDPQKYYVRVKEYEDILEELRAGNTVLNRQIELRIPGGDGSTAWTLASYMPLHYLGEDAVLGWFYNITTLKQTEATLSQAMITAESASKELRVLRDSDMEDLEVANNIMTHIMRSEGLSDPQVRYFQRPVHQFSGDIITVARDSNGELHIMLADVTGHGLQAALFLLPLSRVFYGMVKKGFKTGDIAKEMNQTMHEIAVTGRFLAAAIAHVSKDGTSVEVWNGGIPNACYVQTNGDLHKFTSRHLPLGIASAEDFDPSTEIFRTQPGTLLLSSDGLTEAENKSGQALGDTRFETIVRNSRPDELFGNIISALESHLEGGVAHDDISIVLARCGS